MSRFKESELKLISFFEESLSEFDTSAEEKTHLLASFAKNAIKDSRSN